MIEKLTPEQEVILADTVKQAVDKFYNFGSKSQTEIRKGVAKLYAYANLKAPKVEFLDFSKRHLGSTYIKKVRSAVRSAVDSAVDSAVRSAVGSAVRSAVGSAVRSAVGSAVDSAVGSAVGSAVDSAVDSAVRSAVDSAVGSAVRSAVDSAVYYKFSWALSYRWNWFNTYHQFFAKILPNYPVDLFEEYMKTQNAGQMYLFMFEKVCFVVKMPEKIDQWVGDGYNRRLHSDKKEAINVSGLKLYFLNGVQFPKDLWTKVVSRKMPFAEIMAIVDVDQRAQAMKYGDFHEFAKMQKAVMVDSHTKITPKKKEVRHELWKFPKGDIFTDDVHFMWYQCPSTGNEYTSGVWESKTVEEAMGRKQGITAEEWLAQIPLVHES